MVATGVLAGLPLLAGVRPASAQPQPGAVVCMGSEIEPLASSGPVQRVIRRDTGLVYRAGVDFSDQVGGAQGLRAELGAAGEVNCAWSDAEQNHVVVVGYQGVVRQDLTIAPEEPRLQSIAVGYGPRWEEAEQNATRLNDRFASNFDGEGGEGYEVLVRETWGGASAVAGGGAPGARTPVAGATTLEPDTVFRDCAACPEMVVVPPGSFMMGSPATEAGRYDDEGPRHRVTIGSAFAVGVYEVTFAEWDACVRAGGCGGYGPEDEGWGRGRRPVIHVSWEDAQSYVEWLSGETGARYRLLSEAEWEYVARAGTNAARYWGESASSQCRYGNGLDASAAAKYRNAFREEGWEWVPCTDGYAETAPVGSYAPNAFGLYDVLGNAWEWTEDCWNESYAGAPTDGSAWGTGGTGDCSSRVLRGGAWGLEPIVLRSALRGRFPPGVRSYSDGFRVARTMN